MKFTAVAWDIDGTLVDSEPLHHEALIAACGRFDVDISDLPHGRFIGFNLFDVWAALESRFPSGTNRTDLISTLNAYYVSNAPLRLAIIPGALDIVRALHSAGIPQVAVSNSNRIVVDANLKALGLQGVIAWSVSLDDVARGKPDPLPYRMAAEYLRTPPSSIIAVEDSATGIASAKAAGLKVIGYSQDGRPVAGAIQVVRSLLEIASLFALSMSQQNTSGQETVSKN
jgi:HAD superfamily hydrolase (TIGR01509 family)